jgi:PAS domain S-box-containing protein
VEVLGKRLEALPLVHEADAPFVEAVMERLRAGRERELTHRNRNRTRSGEIRHCEWAHTTIPGRKGQLGSLLSFVTDVTTKVEAEAASRRSESLLEAWCAASPEGFCAVDRGWQVLQWNPSAERMFERSRAEVVGRVLWEVFPRLCGSVFQAAFEEALGDGHSRTVRTAPELPVLVHGHRLAGQRRAVDLLPRRDRAPADGAGAARGRTPRLDRAQAR